MNSRVEIGVGCENASIFMLIYSLGLLTEDNKNPETHRAGFGSGSAWV